MIYGVLKYINPSHDIEQFERLVGIIAVESPKLVVLIWCAESLARILRSWKKECIYCRTRSGSLVVGLGPRLSEGSGWGSPRLRVAERYVFLLCLRFWLVGSVCSPPLVGQRCHDLRELISLQVVVLLVQCVAGCITVSIQWVKWLMIYQKVGEDIFQLRREVRRLGPNQTQRFRLKNLVSVSENFWVFLFFVFRLCLLFDWWSHLGSIELSLTYNIGLFYKMQNHSLVFKLQAF